MFYVYVLKSLIKKWYYIGSAEDIQKRFAQHQKGKVKSTRPYKPLELVHQESFASRAEALRRELELKHHSQKKEALIKNL